MQRIFIWGTGKIADQVFDQCSIFDQYEVMGFIDNDYNKVGQSYRDRKVFAPDVLKEMIPDKIVILTDSYDEIQKQICSAFSDMDTLIENKNYFYKQSLIKRYEKSTDVEIRKVLSYIKANDIRVFNYEFVDQYRDMEVYVQFDSECGLYFVCHKGKRLYFARFLDTEEKVRKYYRDLLIEQDDKSPHKYLDSQFQVEIGDIVVDIGAAEGIFSLEIAERASKIYLIETDAEWIDALRETFKDYRDKVVMINRFVTSMEEGRFATLDSLIKEPVHFIKMDIEGNEWDALLGAKALINASKRLKCAVCSYHGDFDETLIKCVLKEYGLEYTTTPGYMWYPSMLRQTYISTRLCRGIVRGIKNE